MNQNEHYYDDGGGELAPVSHSKRASVALPETFALGNPDSKMHRKIARRAEVTATHEYYRSGLVKRAIVHTGELSQAADAVCEIVPSSTQAVRGLVTTYAISVAEKLARW